MRRLATALLCVALMGAVGAAPPPPSLTAGEAATPRFVPRHDITVAQHDNLWLVSVLAPGGAPYAGTSFSVLREEPDAFGKTRHKVMATSGPAATAGFRLGPGRYRVQVRNGAVKRDEVVEVPATGVFRHEVVLDAGELRLNALLDAGGTEAPETWLRVLRDDNDPYGRSIRTEVAADGYAAAASFLLPAGGYIVEATYGNAVQEFPVHVDAGRQTRQSLVLHAGRLQLSAALAADGAPAAQTVFHIERGVTDVRGPRRWMPVATSDPTGAIAFLLPAGDYRVRAELDHASVSATLSLAAGETRSLDLVLNAGELRLETTLEGGRQPLPMAWFSVSPAGDQARPSVAAQAAEQGPQRAAHFVLPAGRYLATARVGESERSVPVEVAAGSQQSALIPLHAGRVSLTLVAAPGKGPYADTWFSVYRVERDAQGQLRRRRLFNEGYFAETDVVLPAGDYIVFARHGGQRGERRFAVLPGEVKSLAVVVQR